MKKQIPLPSIHKKWLLNKLSSKGRLAPVFLFPSPERDTGGRRFCATVSFCRFRPCDFRTRTLCAGHAGGCCTDRRNSSLCKKLYITFPSDSRRSGVCKPQHDTRQSLKWSSNHRDYNFPYRYFVTQNPRPPVSLAAKVAGDRGNGPSERLAGTLLPFPNARRRAV